MRRLKLHGILTGLILGFVLAPNAWAAITGITDIPVTVANYVPGSNNVLVYEFQMSGTAGSTDTLEELTIGNTGSAAINMNFYDLSNLLTVWYQPSSPYFSPARRFQ